MKINGQTYTPKYSIRAMFLWEQIQDKPFSVSTLLDQYLFFYCMILASEPDSTLTFDEFIDAVDQDPEIITEFLKILNANSSQQDMYSNVNNNELKKA